MKKNLIKCILLLTIPFSLIGCEKKEEPITNKDESTIIKNATNTDEYLKKGDHKSIAYAFIYNIKDGLSSYESETNGTIKSKVAFINYDIKYHSITYKNGSAFYSKDHSTSPLLNVDNEFYMASKDKILVSRDLKKYDVYTLEDYVKVSYTPAQYTIMGYVFNDQSISKTEVLSDKGDIVSIKYTLDNELATNIVKVDLKVNGGLNAYPVFKSIELTLSMKRDFTPVSYAIDATYEASKPIIGSADVKQHGECLFSKVNEKINVPNENYLAEKLGAKPSEIIYNDEEDSVKNELLEAVKNLDFVNGVNVNGNLTLHLFENPIVLNIDTDVSFDISKLSTDKIYSLFNLHAKLEGDETFNSLVSLIKTFAGEQLGDFVTILDNFKSVEVIYDTNGQLYLIPTNSENVHSTILLMKLTDIADLLLKSINVYNLVSGANTDVFSFEKIKGDKEGNYQVNLTLNPDIITNIKEAINKLFENETYGMLKTLLSYKDFASIKITVDVEDNKVKDLDASISFIKENDETANLLTIHLDAKNQAYDYENKIKEAKELYLAYSSVSELKTRINGLLRYVYVNNAYLANLEQAMSDYEALSEVEKDFIGRTLYKDMENAKNSIEGLLAFLEVYKKYDLNNLTNQDILALAKAYHTNNINNSLLKAEISEEDYNKVTDLSSLVNYDVLNTAVSKMQGEDENAWGLTEQEIRDLKLLFDIAEYESGVSGKILITILISTGTYIDTATLKVQINNLYNNLP